MEQKLRNLLNEKIDGLSAQEAAPDFDRAQTWETLAGRLEPRKTRTFSLGPQWRYAAAALLIGLVAGALTWNYLQPEAPAAAPAVASGDRQEPAGTVAPAAPRSAARATPPATASAPPPAVAVAAAPAPASRTQGRAAGSSPQPVFAASAPPVASVPEKVQPPRVRPPVHRLLQGQLTQTAATPSVAVGAPARPAPAPRALHLLELETEDQTALLTPGTPVQPGRSFSIYLSPKRLPDGRDEAGPGSVLRPLFR